MEVSGGPPKDLVRMSFGTIAFSNAGKVRSEVAESCPTLSDPMDCGPPGSNVHGIFQARVLECHLMRRVDSLEKTLMLGKEEKGTEDKMVGWHHRLNGCEPE